MQQNWLAKNNNYNIFYNTVLLDKVKIYSFIGDHSSTWYFGQNTLANLMTSFEVEATVLSKSILVPRQTFLILTPVWAPFCQHFLVWSWCPKPRIRRDVDDFWTSRFQSTQVAMTTTMWTWWHHRETSWFFRTNADFLWLIYQNLSPWK